MIIDWRSNNKTLICQDCPFAEEKESCLIAGLPDPLATLTFVLERPLEESAFRGRPLHDRDGTVFRHLISSAQQKAGDLPPYQVLYAVGYPGRGSVPARASTVCSTYASQRLLSHRKQYERANPGCKKLHVVVPLGATATRSLIPGLRNFNSSRGRPVIHNVQGSDFVVLPTFGMGQINGQPGVVPMVVDDIAKAFRICRRDTLEDKTPDLEDLTDAYVIPRTSEELISLTEEILAYTDPSKQKDPDKWPIAVDTETNSLDPWRSDSRVLMVSIAWDDRKSTAICLHHEDSPYPEEVARECLARIMKSPKPKIFHNMKFDYQFLHHCEGFEVNNLWWDTLLGEHFLNEDIRGFYNLETLVKAYVPAYDGYKSRIQTSLVERVKQDLVKGLDQEEPDFSKSTKLTPFYPDILYEPVCETEEYVQEWESEDLKKIFDLEWSYIKAHINKDSKEKSRTRSRIRAFCKARGLTPPKTIKDRNYEKELEGKGFENVPLDVLLIYAATDTDVTRIICRHQQRKAYRQKSLSAMRRLMRDILVPASTVLGDMEYLGTAVDPELLHKTLEELTVTENKHLEAMRSLVCDNDFNPNSTVQLGDIVTSRLPVDPDDLETSETGQTSVTAAWVSAMADKYNGKPQGEFFTHLLIFRACVKARGFIEKYLELAEHDGQLHPTFWINGTKTGRLSCQNPNLQQIPLWMVRFPDQGYSGWNIKRPLTVRDSENMGFWQADISQAEIRVLCAYSQDPELTRALREGLDVHSFITAKVFDHTYDFVVSQKDTDKNISHQREACKRVVFGTLYGAGVTKIAEQIYGSLSNDTAEKSRQISFASDVRETLFSRFPRIRQYVDQTQREAYLKGYVDTFFGRRRRFSLGKATDMHRYKAEREAVNFRIQSTSSDIVLHQLIEVHQNLHTLGATLQLTVHDSLAGETPLHSVWKMKEFFDKHIVESVAEKFKWLPVPFAYDLEVGPTYGDPIDISILTTSLDNMNDKQRRVYEGLNESQKEFYEKVQNAR